MGRRVIIIVIVIGLSSLWTATALGKLAPFSYWTASDAGRSLVRANLQVGFQLAHHTTITSAACKGSGVPLTRQHRRVYRAFDCTAQVHDDEINADDVYTVSFVTSKYLHGRIGCWARDHAGLVAKHCL